MTEQEWTNIRTEWARDAQDRAERIALQTKLATGSETPLRKYVSSRQRRLVKPKQRPTLFTGRRQRKLSPVDVRASMMLLDAGWSMAEVGKRFAVSAVTIHYWRKKLKSRSRTPEPHEQTPQG